MFIIIELQTDAEGHTGNIVQTKETKEEALSTFFSICASAAISQVRYHTVMAIDEQGRYVTTGQGYARECFEHITPSENILTPEEV